MPAQKSPLPLLPVPRSAVWVGGGCFRMPAAPEFAPCAADTAAARRVLLRELGPGTWCASPARAVVRFAEPSTAPDDLKDWADRPQGFGLEVSRRGVRIWASDPAGRFYAATTLRQLRTAFRDRIPGLHIGDAPVLGHRGAMLSFPQGYTEYRPDYLRHLVPRLARWKINALYLYLETYFDFPSLPHTAGPGAMTPADAKALDQLCRDYHIQLIPQLNLMAHNAEILGLQQYAHLVEYPPDRDPRTLSGFNLCATHPQTHRLVERILADITAVFSADILHVGGDEVSALGECPGCRKRAPARSKPDLYLDYFSRIRDTARQGGKRIGLWGDMLLHHYRHAPAARRNAAFDRIRDGTIVYDWHYEGGSPETLRFFSGENIATVACSSSNLCYSASVWPGQALLQRDLFRDAVAAGAMGGMTTAWLNFAGMHEEQVNLLSAAGATALWSGPTPTALAPGLDMRAFERAYGLHRYGLRSDTLTKYFHLLGDAGGPVLRPLAPLHGANIRKCLYHTDNVLTFWTQYAHILRGRSRQRYRAGLARARALWTRVATEDPRPADRYFKFLEAPLLMHEHLLRRFEMTEALFRDYDAAARAQFVRPRECERRLERAAQRLLDHREDFTPILRYHAAARRELGLDRATAERLSATRRKIRELAAFLRYLSRSRRPLPAFASLNGRFMREARTDWAGGREHEWAGGPARFRRYTLENGPWYPGPNPMIEPGPRVAVRDYRVSRFDPRSEPVSRLSYPSKPAELAFEPKHYASASAMVHFDRFNTAADGYVWFLCRFRCDEPMKLEAGIGYDGPLKVWLNRQPVFEDPAGTNPAWPDKARIPFPAAQGEHELMLALSSNRGRAYGVQVRIERCDRRTAPLPVVLEPSLPADLTAPPKGPARDLPVYILTAPERTEATIEAAYAEIPPVRYAPPANRWRHLPRTERILAGGAPLLRVVMLGDSIIGDTSRSEWDLVLQRSWPACRIMKVTVIRGSTGCGWYQQENRVHALIYPHRPDLLIIGGISQNNDTEAIRTVIRQARALHPCDVLLLSGAFGRTDPRRDPDWTDRIPRDPGHYRFRLRALAQAEKTGFLDMTAHWGRYVRSAGVELDTLKRDGIHANVRGEQILGRILAAHLGPPLSAGRTNGARGQETTSNRCAQHPAAIHVRPRPPGACP